MAYATTETSLNSGQPIECYGFTSNDGNWYYTNNADPVSPDGLSMTFEPMPISRSSVSQTQEMGRANLELEMPITAGLVMKYAARAPHAICSVTVYRWHRDSGDNAITIWMGRIISVQMADAVATVICEPVFTSLRRTGLPRRYQTSCPHALYGDQCGVNAASYAVAGTVTAISGKEITVTEASGYADNYFSGGRITSGTDTFFIVGHTGTTVVLASDAATVASSITLYPGCNHSIGTCSSKFSNALNFGGQPHFTKKNPFTEQVF